MAELNTILKQVQKPGRYTGGEFCAVCKDKEKVKERIAFCFPDTYEIGMSNLGVRLLSGALNEIPEVWCERAYAPWPDMEEKMRENGIPLYAHESRDPLTVFDMVAFTLQYELCYSNVLNMLDLAGIPLLAKDRGEEYPVILGGGPCAYNAEPVADFFDLFSIGEGEEALPELARLWLSMKEEGSYTKEEFLHRAAKLPGFYVPSFYEVEYNADGTIARFVPKYDDIPMKITKRIVKDMDTSYFPSEICMPYIETVHDRVVLETGRGCIRGCRFCQACMLFRPVREKSPEVLNRQAKALIANTGYDEITLSSLSISDYSRLDELTGGMLPWTEKKMVSLSLPSLRVDSFTKELMDRMATVRMGGITFAPEAGTQRLRDAINKNVEEADLMRACRVAFEGGKSSVKLYFMNGLPTETDEDIAGIADLSEKVVKAYFDTPSRNKARGINVTISVACFVPKPFTAFQWEAQDELEVLMQKQMYLAEKITDRKHIRYTWHDAHVSHIEAVFARGSRKLSAALLRAHELGVKFDGWDEYFDFDKWMQAFNETGIDTKFYANRRIGTEEVLPWDLIDCGVTKTYFLRERQKAYESVTTPSCKEGCAGCGANRLGGKTKWCPQSK